MDYLMTKSQFVDLARVVRKCNLYQGTKPESGDHESRVFMTKLDLIKKYYEKVRYLLDTDVENLSDEAKDIFSFYVDVICSNSLVIFYLNITNPMFTAERIRDMERKTAQELDEFFKRTRVLLESFVTEPEQSDPSHLANLFQESPEDSEWKQEFVSCKQIMEAENMIFYETPESTLKWFRKNLKQYKKGLLTGWKLDHFEQLTKFL